MNRPITNAQFDIDKGEITRLCKMYLLNRIVPMGYMAGFTRMRQLLILLLVHRFGRLLFRHIIPHEDRLTRLYRRFRKRRMRATEPTA